MIELGIKSSDLYGESKCCVPCDVDKEVRYPSLYLDGKHAQLMGLQDLEVGKEYEVTIRVRAQRISKNTSETEDGKKVSVDGSLAIVAMGNWESDEEETPTDQTARVTARVMRGATG